MGEPSRSSLNSDDGSTKNLRPPAGSVLARSMLPSSEAFPVSDDLGPHSFQKLKMLGRGAVGKVYLVLLKGTEKVYAMKVLTKKEMIEKNKIKRVLTEREILATVNHPFIITMYASFQTAERLYYVMDFCQGGEFYQFLQKQPNKRLPESAVKFYIAEVVLALEYLHHMGFIYRDLKPENVLMRANGHVALTDFDLSKQGQAISPRVVETHLSLMQKMKSAMSSNKANGPPSGRKSLEILDSEPVLTGDCTSFVGTEEYIAPEIVDGTNQTAAVDWWTVGILCYEMLFGQTPFKGGTQDETFRNILGGKQLQFPDDIPVSKDCKNFVRSLLKKDVSKRLGGTNGATDIKAHAWLKCINMNLIRNARAPAIPRLRDPLDMTQYKPLKNPEFEPTNVSSDGTSKKNNGADSDEEAGVDGSSTEKNEQGNGEAEPNPFANFDVVREDARSY
uniref:non-specific serine/threonine protein kinase n=1 Tax=Compsopogon caeruleus TaxID=31354 RepID=A0A7S1XE55_9RHOD|mmetsp:Transcript_16614/g.34065  ORF Transcript_16614/g.34065 Transcript_16614/m.34065 type:complete len:448 (+) Transcript_16614:409-1752(+)|eukprot:CAMPEP_0184682462 /NCGR_PEP_ID=MMETSP0312-20130426/7324_1 /TAXON_ID=31354 /ORGANISM="Compsopogon coeruleus, Strain SAG 36.94" /LENGTH=447 /DNA_ID=CAMNT_0027134149 /DNA_START=389 /DNA_END=1732 /DNA_ORIENTATION=+